MKALEKVRNRIKRYLKRRKKPVIRITDRDPYSWRRERLVRVPVPYEKKKNGDLSYHSVKFPSKE